MTFEPVHPIFWDFSDGDPWVLRYLRRYAGRVRKMLKRIWRERIDQLGWMLACAEPGPNDPLKLNTLAFIRNELHNLVGKGCADAWPLMLEVDEVIDKIIALLVKYEAEGLITINLVNNPLGLEEARSAS